MNDYRIFTSIAAVAALTALALFGGNVADTLAQSEEDLVTIPTTFVDGTPAEADEVNANFSAVATGVNTLDGKVKDLGDEIAELDGRVETLEAASADVSNTVTVAKSGGDFSSVAEALASITDNSEDNPYVVLVFPGVYTETDLVRVKEFVHLKGMGELVTVIRSTRTGNNVGDDAATVRLDDLGSISDLTVLSEGAGFAIGIIGAGLSRDTIIDRVTATASGDGGTGHFGAHLTESDVTVKRSTLRASGASTVNAGLGSTDTDNAFAQPLFEDCKFEGKGINAGGFGLQLRRTAATVRGSHIYGDERAISTSLAGISRIIDCRVNTLGLNPVYDLTDSATILSFFVEFVGGDPTGLASRFKYTHCVKPNGDPVVNGIGSDI